MPEKGRPLICLLGASFDTGNLGVSALAWSSIKCILHRWPQAEVYILGVGREVSRVDIEVGGCRRAITCHPIRFHRNLFVPNHILRIMWLGTLARFMSLRSWLRRRLSHSESSWLLLQADLVLDITGGDSFSDIYGIARFMRGFLVKSLVFLYGKPLVMLPQTYGPFRLPLTRRLASFVLKRACKVLSRDRKGLEEVARLVHAPKARLIPDVAFVLDPLPFSSEVTEGVRQASREGQRIIGVNISGLLYHGGYTRNNMFGLKADYARVMQQIVVQFAKEEDTRVVLVSHVSPRDSDSEVESDPHAARVIWGSLDEPLRHRVIIAPTEEDPRRAKYLIGLCDFFLGARMHACIAALSQTVPTVGLAYSPKFLGVFETVGMADCVADARSCSDDQLIAKIMNVLSQRQEIRSRLAVRIPEVQSEIMALLDDVKVECVSE